jgi:hypothetical protein
VVTKFVTGTLTTAVFENYKSDLHSTTARRVDIGWILVLAVFVLPVERRGFVRRAFRLRL